MARLINLKDFSSLGKVRNLHIYDCLIDNVDGFSNENLKLNNVPNLRYVNRLIGVKKLDLNNINIRNVNHLGKIYDLSLSHMPVVDVRALKKVNSLSLSYLDDV